MRIIEFIERFPTEESCKLDFKHKREQEGVYCKRCHSSKHYWLKAKWQWQCSKCNFRTTLRSGTIMENSNLPFRTWYLAMAFMSFSKKGISAKEMQRQLNHKRYNTIWSLMHRIRNAMGNRDNLYVLEGMIEYDEAYFIKVKPENIKLKRGKGSQRTQNVAVMAESIPLEDIYTGKKSKHCRYFKMKVLDSHKSKEINKSVEENIDELSIMFTDKSSSYLDIKNYVETHIMEKSTKKTTETTLKWVHIIIANAKRVPVHFSVSLQQKSFQQFNKLNPQNSPL